MPVKKKLTWLLLLLRLPATHKAERVAIWRKVKNPAPSKFKLRPTFYRTNPRVMNCFSG